MFFLECQSCQAQSSLTTSRPDDRISSGNKKPSPSKRGIFIFIFNMNELLGLTNGLDHAPKIMGCLANLLEVGVVVTPANKSRIHPLDLVDPVEQLSLSFPRLIDANLSRVNPEEDLLMTVNALCSLRSHGCRILLPKDVSISCPKGQTVSHIDGDGQTNYSKWKSSEERTAGDWLFTCNKTRIRIPNQA